MVDDLVVQMVDDLVVQMVDRNLVSLFSEARNVALYTSCDISHNLDDHVLGPSQGVFLWIFGHEQRQSMFNWRKNSLVSLHAYLGLVSLVSETLGSSNF